MLVDASAFPVGLNLDYESEDEVEALAALQPEAKAFVESDSPTKRALKLQR